MKIRTITVFDDISANNYQQKLTAASKFLKNKSNFLTKNFHEIQTTRVSCQLFDYVKDKLTPSEFMKIFEQINEICVQNNITFFNPGTLKLTEEYATLINKLPEILKHCRCFNCSLELVNTTSLYKQAEEASLIFKNIVKHDFQSTFRYGIHANCPELIPFYPASYYKGKEPKFAIGLQIPTTINQVADFSLEYDTFFDDLFIKLNNEIKELERLLKIDNDNYKYFGIDTSIAPMVEEKDSIGAIYEKILKAKIGTVGTLAVTSKFTEIAKKIEVLKTGYCGMMLPPLEDKVLAKRFSEGTLTIQKLLYYSTVCACGLDTVPVSSKVSNRIIAAIYLDMATLAFKHNKPLTVRLMSIPNSKPGDLTIFSSPYTCNTRLTI